MRLPVPHVVVQWHIGTVHHCLSQHVVVAVPGLVGLVCLDSLYDRKYMKGRIFTQRLLHWLFSIQLFIYIHIKFTRFIPFSPLYDNLITFC